MRWVLSICLLCLSTYLSVLLANSSDTHSESASSVSKQNVSPSDGTNLDILLDRDAIAAYEIDRKAREFNSETNQESEVKRVNIKRYEWLQAYR